MVNERPRLYVYTLEDLLYNYHNVCADTAMGFFFVLIISSLAGGFGWWVGNFFGIVAALLCSVTASLVGYYYGQKWNREYFG